MATDYTPLPEDTEPQETPEPPVRLRQHDTPGDYGGIEAMVGRTQRWLDRSAPGIVKHAMELSDVMGSHYRQVIEEGCAAGHVSDLEKSRLQLLMDDWDQRTVAERYAVYRYVYDLVNSMNLDGSKTRTKRRRKPTETLNLTEQV